MNPEAPVSWRKDKELSDSTRRHSACSSRSFTAGLAGRRVNADTFLYTTERPDGQGNKIKVEIPDQVIANTVVGDGLPVHYAHQWRIRIHRRQYRDLR